MRRVHFALVALVIGGVLATVTAGQASATGGGDRTVFRGKSAFAVVTNCTPSTPVGRRCDAATISGNTERVNDNGTVTVGRFINVTIFKVRITPDGFESVPIESGFSDSGTVDIAGDLSKAFLQARNLQLETCDQPDPEQPPVCSPTRKINVRADFTKNDGPSTRTTARYKTVTGDCVFINRSRSKVVGADVVARVGGLDLVSTPAFPSSMSKSSETFVIRGCDGPALAA